MYIFIVLPVFLFAILTGVESWLWKCILFLVVGASWYLWGPACIAVAVALIIGIATKNSLAKIGGSKV